MANTFVNRISGSIGATETTIYTTPVATTTTVIGVAVSNRLQSNILVDVKLVESGSLNTAFLCTGSLIPPGSNIILVGGEQKVVTCRSGVVERSINPPRVHKRSFSHKFEHQTTLTSCECSPQTQPLSY